MVAIVDGGLALKKTTSGATALLATLGVTPEDAPLFVAVLFGLITGTACAWARERQNGHSLPRRWLVYQVAAWGFIFLFSIVVGGEWLGLSPRGSGLIAGALAFASRDGLQGLHKRALREIDEREP